MQIIRNGKGEGIVLYPLMPNKMAVNRDEKGQLYYTYRKSQEELPKDSRYMVVLSL